MNNLKIVGLAGLIGSGKSTVAKLLSNFGAKIIDADRLSRLAVAPPDGPCLKNIEKCFGAEVFESNGQLNRKRLGQLIFSDPLAKQNLEQILHPQIRMYFLEQVEQVKAQIKYDPESLSVLVYEASLLIRNRSHYPEISQVILVVASKDVCLARIMKRDNLTDEQAAARYDSQLSESEQRKEANYIIENNGDLSELEIGVAKLWKWLQKK